MSGVAAVQARMAEISARIAMVSGATPSAAIAVSSRDVNSSARSDAAFAAALDTAVAGTASSSSSGLSTSELLARFTGAQGGTGAAFVASASKYLGVPYVWGGEDATGMDCSGLIQRAFADMGVSVPRTAREQMKVGTEVGSLAQAQPGDLIVTRGGAHIAIYLGDNKILHAPRPGEQVSVRELFETDADIDTIRRVVPAGSAPGFDAAQVAATAAAGLGGSAALGGLGTGGVFAGLGTAGSLARLGMGSLGGPGGGAAAMAAAEQARLALGLSGAI
ncbi:C40 family peptidase [Georgenia yuyongxinii]|uniref:NlpC/P60 family protein n=1 Tax=Georgenia yuyongxinii TaxID=2589797 RepID=A0A552WSD0_9MICO|nr:C40 family peptidase [Georgenia yuyongxinii]TRW45627.1 NlpC/P60 family protein [Georgenia yuyongxinii]